MEMAIFKNLYGGREQVLGLSRRAVQMEELTHGKALRLEVALL